MNRKLIGALAAVTVVCAGPAFAQGLSNQVMTPIGAPSTNQRARVGRPTEAPPVGVPGSHAEPTAVAPPDKVAADMPPTDALFDAINRGDLTAAKDAVNRGADIHGHNVLGLSPLELSVDLGRNNISFLLLSLRGGSGYTTASGHQSGEPAAPPTAAERRAALRAEQQERRRETIAARTVAAPAAAPTARTARLFAGDGGAPVPQAGFLGFGSTR